MSFQRISLLASVMLVLFGVGACTTVTIEKPVPAPVLATPVSPVVPTTKPVAGFRPAEFATLPGWDKDDLREAWPAFRASCDVLAKNVDWREYRAGSMQAMAMRFEFFSSPFLFRIKSSILMALKWGS